ncbi:MAG: DUF1631 family protein, partial [Pseudomonas sp.]
MSTQDPPSHTAKPTPALASRGIQPRFGELVQGCRELVMNRLAEHLSGVFAQVDDTLFECADKAENNQVQTLFFDSMRDIRKHRAQIERSYHQQIAQNFSDFLEGKLKPTTSVDEVDAEQLALVRNEDYEESLQIINMVSRVKARCVQPLFALEQRLALLNNGQKLGEDNNPFGPQAIAQAFREALAPCPFPLRIKVILYMLFDRHVMQSLDSLYSALNQQLIDASVLPNLKYGAQRAASPPRADTASSTPPTTEKPATRPQRATDKSQGKSHGQGQGQGQGQKQGPATAATPATTPVDLGGPPPSDPAALFSGLAALLGEHRQRDGDAPLLGGTRSIASFAPLGATRTYSAHELLDALNRLQRQSAHELAQRLQHPQRVEGLKSDLQQQLEAHSSLPGQQKLADQEADIIDLV